LGERGEQRNQSLGVLCVFNWNCAAKEIEMKRSHLIRIGALGLAAIAILLANILLASANPVLTASASPLTFTFTVDNTGKVNRIGFVTVGGTMSCDVPGAFAFVSGQVMQLSGRAQLSGSFSFYGATCGPTPTPWSATLRADNGIFTGGPANVSFSAQACVFNGYFEDCSFTSGTQSIKLVGGS
jgi:hypothetical protein